MATLNKLNVKVAAANRTKLDLSCDHVTTMQFMKMQPVYYRHMLKGEHLNFDCFANIRPAPMNVPTYGRMRCNLRGFFVPYHLVFPKFESFMADSIASNYGNSSLVTLPPILKNSQVLIAFTNPLLAVVDNSAVNPDFIYNTDKYVFTSYGRWCYKIFYSLGYDILPGNKDEFQWNGLALLSMARVYIDWYANSNYLDSSDVLNIEQALAFNQPNSNLNITAGLLLQIFAMCSSVVFDSNGYFESCFDNPVSPIAAQHSSFVMTDVSINNGVYGTGYVATDSNGTPVMIQDRDTDQYIGTQYMHDILDKLSSYQRRHALAGSQAIDRLLAQYGVVTDNLKMQRSIYCGYQSIDIGVGDIYATANGTNPNGSSEVGDFAGRGFGRGGQTWDFKSDNEGIFIVFASILPDGGYYQGYDRINTLLEKTEFFNPEFDGTIDVIHKGEVYVSHDEAYINGDPQNYKGVFGYCGRYGAFKRPINRVSGDIALKSVLDGGDSWHLNRDLDREWNDYSTCSHSLSFTRSENYWKFDRIFNYASADRDPFYCFFHFDVGAYAPCKPLFEMFDFSNEKGQEITMTNGAKVN